MSDGRRRITRCCGRRAGACARRRRPTGTWACGSPRTLPGAGSASRIPPSSCRSTRICGLFPRKSGRHSAAQASDATVVRHRLRALPGVASERSGPHLGRSIARDNLKLFSLAALRSQGRATGAIQASDRSLPASRAARHVHLRLARQQLGFGPRGLEGSSARGPRPVTLITKPPAFAGSQAIQAPILHGSALLHVAAFLQLELPLGGRRETNGGPKRAKWPSAETDEKATFLEFDLTGPRGEANHRREVRPR